MSIRSEFSKRFILLWRRSAFSMKRRRTALELDSLLYQFMPKSVTARAVSANSAPQGLRLALSHPSRSTTFLTPEAVSDSRFPNIRKVVDARLSADCWPSAASKLQRNTFVINSADWKAMASFPSFMARRKPWVELRISAIADFSRLRTSDARWVASCCSMSNCWCLLDRRSTKMATSAATPADTPAPRTPDQSWIQTPSSIPHKSPRTIPRNMRLSLREVC